jgi:hypothetical protein
MDWMNQLGGILQQYTGETAQAPATVHDDFDQLAQNAPPSAISEGLAAAFRSDQTPDFGQMAANLYSNSGGQQRAGILNTLLKAAGPALISQVLARGGTSGGGGGGLSSLIGLLRGGQQEVTPEQAAQVSPEAVKEIAEQAHQQDPSIIDRVSDFYAQHPTLIKTLGAAALTIALSKIAQRQYNG